MVSLSEGRYNYSLAAAVGLTIGVAGLCKALYSSFLIPWVSQKKLFLNSDRVYYTGGLKNLGNNCFLNVILQALASCNGFVSSLDNLLGDEDVLPEEKSERMPLIFALNSLINDLNIVRNERTALNPEKVMHALSFYVSHFNLARQQDASEAFLHLLTSLRDEFSHCYYTRKGKLSLDFENFYCLPLTPMTDINGDIINGCSLVDCLKYFTVLEHLDNYRCDRCWHNAAANHLSLKSEVYEGKINKLRSCVDYDTCSCRHIFSPEEMTCSVSSQATKQLAITHCPKILCIHLQRASVGLGGELVKRDGHISFPLLLDLSPFTGGTFIPGQRPGPSAMNMQRHGQQALRLLRQLNVEMPVSMFPTAISGDSSSHPHEDEGINILGCSYYVGNKDTATRLSSSSTNKLYNLSAVVEHYGVSGGGHYAAYRRVTPNSDSNDPVQSLASSGKHWLYISDDHVSDVSEDDVLAAEATLLFYERL
ncbi:hypothetical protein GUJ93_ZPchr0025g2901 [Zizania palustris]|uniref:Ubiquitin carboxyl-terminal hydrolase n=1 Tax=Zizania palustris TaxID=103762 RepID=A0A8J5RA34_ZIZPA|nr:hypothetical protein GUJ93_ZPchr0025g2901 [Zizania palustris]